jgi:hypothetical protein
VPRLQKQNICSGACAQLGAVWKHSDSANSVVAQVDASVNRLRKWLATPLADLTRNQSPDPVRETPRRAETRLTGRNSLLRPLSMQLDLPTQSLLLVRAKPETGQTCCSASSQGGSWFVALLPHVQAAKLTIYASYW